jgi:hypothetical protein
MPEITSSKISASAEPGLLGRFACSAALYALRISETVGVLGSSTSFLDKNGMKNGILVDAL